MDIATSQYLHPWSPVFMPARSIVMMALRRLTENDDEFNREIVILILPQGYPFSPTDPRQARL